MLNIYQFGETQIIFFVLIFVRVSAFFFTFPIFSAENVPVHVRILLSLLVSFLLHPVLWKAAPLALHFSDAIILIAVKELFVGLALGGVTRMVFHSVTIAGQMLSSSIGLSSAQIYNPTLGIQSTIIEQFEVTFASLVFLAVNGHHVMISELAASFQYLPLNFDTLHFEGVKTAALLGQEVISLGIRISAPVVVALFLAQIAMGIVGRAVPQINVLVTSLHLTILIGLIVIFLSLPLFVSEMTGLKDIMADQVFGIMRKLKGI